VLDIRPFDIMYEYKNTLWQSNLCTLSTARVQNGGKCFLPTWRTVKTPGARTSVQQFVTNDGRVPGPPYRSHVTDLAFDDSPWKLGQDLRVETFRPLVERCPPVVPCAVVLQHDLLPRTFVVRCVTKLVELVEMPMT
jgi:hypothetical protein